MTSDNKDLFPITNWHFEDSGQLQVNTAIETWTCKGENQILENIVHYGTTTQGGPIWATPSKQH